VEALHLLVLGCDDEYIVRRKSPRHAFALVNSTVSEQLLNLIPNESGFLR
jgi:hypothetical protein